MSLESDIVLLSDVPLFENLSQEHLRLLAFSAVQQDFGPGTVLFRAGDPALCGYVVASGRVDLTAGEGEPPALLATCRRGYLIGEIALFIEVRRAATAVVVEASRLLELSRPLVIKMMTEYPQAAIRIRRSLGDRVADTVGDLRKVREALLRLDQRR